MDERSLKCALYYISEGWRVFPCHTIVDGQCTCGKDDCGSPGKHPFGKLAPKGAKDASISEDIIRAWFGGQYDVNIAVVAGVESGLVLLDIDSYNGGDDSLQRYPDLPKTPTVATGGGGKHYYFKHPGGDIRNSSGKSGLGIGLDVRGHHGYVIAPPSRHKSGKEYKWAISPGRSVAVALCPEWVIGGDKKKEHKGTRNKSGQEPSVGEKLKPGDRHAYLLNMAGRLRQASCQEPEIYAALAIINERVCDPAKSESAMRELARSICDYERGDEPEVEEKLKGVFLDMCDVEEKDLEWLWPEVIPIGMISMIISQEQAGKSHICANMAAVVTGGGCWHNAPDVARSPGRVIVFSHEEDPSILLVPKYRRQGADLSRCRFFKTITEKDGEVSFDIAEHIDILRAETDLHDDVRLVVFDPITSYVSANENSNSQIRQALKPLVDYAGEKHLAVLGLSHLNKKVDLGMINRTLGSRAWNAVPRMIWAIDVEKQADEEDNLVETGRRFFLCVKSNVSRRPQGFQFEINDEGVVVWSERRTNRTMDDRREEKDQTEIRAKFAEALDWLEERLQQGAALSNTIFEEAKESGWSKNQMYRAKKKLKVRATRSDFAGDNRWFWALPEGENELPF